MHPSAQSPAASSRDEGDRAMIVVNPLDVRLLIEEIDGALATRGAS